MPYESEIWELRKEIDKIDGEIIKLLEKRFQIVNEIWKIKKKTKTNILDKTREREILERAGTYRAVFEKILELSVDFQHKLLVDSRLRTQPRTTIGIVGYGKMGKLFAKLFSKHHIVNIFDIKYPQYETNNQIFIKRSLAQLVHDSKYIMIATSLPEVYKVAARIREIIREKHFRDRVVFDIATLKDKVIRELSQYPETIKVASVHPMFGGYIKQPWRHKILIMPIKGREEDALEVEKLFKPFGFELVFVEPEDHDKYITYTITLPYLLGILFKHITKEADSTQLSIYGGTSFNLFASYVEDVVEKDAPDFIYELLTNRRTKHLMEKTLNILSLLYHEPSSILGAK